MFQLIYLLLSTYNIQHAIIEYADIGIEAAYIVTGTVSNSTLRYNLTSVSVRTLGNNDPVYDPTFVLSNSRLHNNAMNYLASSLVGVMDARNNWWGSVDVGEIESKLTVGKVDYSNYLTVGPNNQPPQINITSPANNSYTSENTSTIIGMMDEDGTLTINGVSITIDESFAFTYNIDLQEGENIVTLVATDVLGGFQTQILIINKDTVVPVEINASKLTLNTSGAHTTVAGTAASVEAGATVNIITNGITTTVVANANGSFSAIVNASSGDQIQIIVIDSADNSSTTSSYILGALQIISPQTSDIINEETVNVVGVFANEGNSGVSVNGTTACTYNNNFYINNLPLTPGANTLTATYTTQSGSSQDTAINVTQSEAASYKFTSDENCSVAPLNVNFNLDTGNNTIQQLDIDYDADGIVDISTTTPTTATLQHSYTEAGVYPVTAWVTSGGSTQQLSLNIVVKDETQQDDTFQAIWSGMWLALKAGDKPTALQYLTPEAVRAYGGVFDSLMPFMTETFDELSVIEPVENGEEIANYAVIRLENGVIKTFMINYSRGNDGIWRIDSM